MAREGPNWDGLLKWSLSHSDGTNSSRSLSEEDRRWFMEAMQGQTVDVIKRMKDITLVMKTPEQVLESQGVTAQDIEDLHSIGGLVPLLDYLRNSHANIRAKAADVVSTIVQNNPRSQQMVMEANGLEPLFSNFTSDPDVGVRAKALGAISSLIRHNKPGVAAFRLANGYAALRDALSSENVKFQRKALNLIDYLLNENRSDVGVINELGFPRIMLHLASSEDPDVREAALRGLLYLARDRSENPESSSEDDDKLKQVLQERIKGIAEMSREDLGAIKEERELVDALWNTCHNEPSPLFDQGLLALPGEDAPPPDVASQHFQPPLRAFAANRNPDAKPKDEKKEPPLLLGPGPSS